MATASGFVKGIAWEIESPFLDVDYEARDALGVPSLKHLATKKILSDQRNLELEHFRHIPWPIAEQLWQYLTRSGKRTLHMWKIFCTVYPDQFRQVSQYCKLGMRTPSFPLAGYMGLVQSSNCCWATSLSIWTQFARVPELVKLAEMANLVSLEINTPYTHRNEDKDMAALNDRILRTWSELVETSRAFQHLRVLRLYSQQNLTGRSFCYLSQLPSLEYCVLAMCDGMTQRSAVKLANSQGWFVIQDDPKHAMFQFSPCDPSKAFDGHKEWYINHSDDFVPSSLPKNTPLLEFSVGQRCERLKEGDVITMCRKLDSHNSHAKGNKRNFGDTVSPKRNDAALKKARKPVMKQRGKDLSGMLAEFV
ncbi:hypothetical protein UA08_05610 [Talaromyces atroroseus]|uniref:Uncharacterized protein n=1 Tax=Talaromyces atroroseus TaxID=1441469 RepID=A0A225AU58_TALAT|nr:hypothetical protein UA08_05610 [Talaromyces atroroseus]OKL59139.1 hypothetical protein UA08_05610 [Talaromyces atroroseus]